jgi:DNA segregation ATPase FtsK/SpoIIIE-like protein
MLGVIGLMIALIAVIAILSPLPKYTNGIAVYFVNVFGFIGFWAFFGALFVFGIYLMFSRKLNKIRFDLSIAGILIVVFASLSLFSNIVVPEAEHLRFDNFISLMQTRLARSSTEGITFNVQIGGGYVGFFLAALFNYMTRPIAIAFTTLIVLFSLGLIFNRQVKKWYVKFKAWRKKKHEQGAYFKAIKKEKPDKFEDIAFQDNKKSEEPTLSPNAKYPTQRSNSEPFIAPKPVVSAETFTGYQKAAPRPEAKAEPKPVVQPTSMAQALPPYRPGNGEMNFQVKSFSGNQGLHKAVFYLEGDEPRSELPPQREAMRPYTSSAEAQAVASEPFFTRLAVEETPLVVKPEPEVSKPAIESSRPTEASKQEIKPRDYNLPPLDLLENHESQEDLLKNEESTQSRTELINTIFEDLNIGAQVVGHTIGPSVTRYDIQMDRNVSVSSMTRYINDISIRLGGVSTRFEPLVIGKPTSGLEIPNEYRTNVGLKEALEKMSTGGRFNRDIPFGKNISGELIYANITDLPHMLVAGSTGSGKSIFVHSILMTLIMRNRPDELKLMVVDPKRVELSNYADIPHLLCPIITESKKAKVAFNKLVDEMEKRYSIFQEARVSKISQYNDYAKHNGLPALPYIVVVVDEYADLSDTCRDIHEPVVRVAQKARAAGIHLIISTQRPTTDVVNPRIKTNLPAHVALMMGSYVDSTTILGESGAEKLLGNGDMLVECAIISRTSKPRLQGCFVDISEINRVADFIKAQWPVEYDPNFLDLEEKVEEYRPMSGADVAGNTSSREMVEEELYTQLIQDTMERDFTSISFIQRTYGVGFPKAGRLFARLQKDGIVSTESDSARGCKVLVHDGHFNTPSANPGSTELVVEEDR